MEKKDLINIEKFTTVESVINKTVGWISENLGSDVATEYIKAMNR